MSIELRTSYGYIFNPALSDLGSWPFNPLVTQVALGALSSLGVAAAFYYGCRSEGDSSLETLQIASKTRFTIISRIFDDADLLSIVYSAARGALMAPLPQKINTRTAYQLLEALKGRIERLLRGYYREEGWKDQLDLCLKFELPDTAFKELMSSRTELICLSGKVEESIKSLKKILSEEERRAIPAYAEFKRSVPELKKAILESRFKEYIQKKKIKPNCAIRNIDNLFTLLGIYLSIIQDVEITKNHLSDIEFLLSQGADPDFLALEPKPLTSLPACLDDPKFLPVFELLLRYGANPYLTDDAKLSLLHGKGTPYEIAATLKDRVYGEQIHKLLI